MSKIDSRKYFLDLLRIIACFCVIVNHTNSQIFLNTAPPSLTWFASLTYFFISKIAVPIFLMITGYLLLNKQDTWRKAFKRIFRIIIVLISCAVIYAGYQFIDQYPNVSVKDFFNSITTVHYNIPTNALWYLYTYLGILLMLPILQKMVSAFTQRDYHIFFIISGFFSGLMPILNHYYSKLSYSSYFYIPIFGGYICMLLIGQYFARYGIKKTKKGLCFAILLLILTVAFNVIATYFEFHKSNTDYLFFDNRLFLPIIIQSACVFYIVTFVNCSPTMAAIISHIGACTFGIYLISDLLITVMQPLYDSLSTLIHPLFAVVLYELLVFSAGFVITAILKKIPSLNKIL